MSRIRIAAPARINANIMLPSSKSISNRALIVSALSHSQIQPRNISDCDDTNVMVRALTHESEVVDIMAAGTAMRFLTAYFSVTPGERVITGTVRMRNRPIGVLVDALRRLGADIEYVEKEGFPPLKIKGKSLEGGELSIPGNVSSQYISALMMIAPMLKRGLDLTLTESVVSQPYINLTMKLMKDFGAEVCWTSDSCIHVEPKTYDETDYFIENDWSGASYWYEISALAREAEVVLPALFENSQQGDCHVADMFARLGVATSYEINADGESLVRLEKNGVETDQFDFDFVNQPDLAQTVVVTCCMLGIKFRFTGLQSLKIKETDRIEALKVELRKLGYVVHDEQNNIMWWNGERCEASMKPIDTYEDHRMAMAFAPCCLVTGYIDMNNPEVVSKSYPHYWDDLRKAGFTITNL